MTDIVHFLSGPDSDSMDAAVIAEASACLDRFTTEFNAGNIAGMEGELHFPHTMLSGAEQLAWDSPGHHPADFFARLRSTGWAFTRYEAKDPVLVSADKVHFVVTYTRRNQQGDVLSTHRNLWIVTRVSGQWGIVLRSY